ncbi:hypothetical protein HPP92_025022 [Vanilla planifolia]|uniref:Uncharacterized protein n=1 Tax=Vanilla planifolia TaxID=51239 RepID=A0A835PJ50_VANPL|nr:hypothetical protein HPP92_025022 [Vanilla planifolia]
MDVDAHVKNDASFKSHPTQPWGPTQGKGDRKGEMLDKKNQAIVKEKGIVQRDKDSSIDAHK